MARDEAVLEIVLIGLRLSKACAQQRVAVGIVGVRVQAVVGVERKRLREQFGQRRIAG